MTSNPLAPGQFFTLSKARYPILELLIGPDPKQSDPVDRILLTRLGEGRHSKESLWTAPLPSREPGEELTFRLNLGQGKFDRPSEAGWYHTLLQTIWLQDGQLFGYRPAELVSPSRVSKIEGLAGDLLERPLYIYLPRGYDQHTHIRYPVLYMHDGQNVFHAFEEDSFGGSWHAEQTADRLIANGQMRESIIVGISHGGPKRFEEYLPPGLRIKIPQPSPPKLKVAGKKGSPKPPELHWVTGIADQTFDFYQKLVAGWVLTNLRASPLREDTAVCGSSMGGLFTLYMAFNHSDFARHYAALSPSLGLTKDENGRVKFFDLSKGTKPDIRLWLDSGTLDAPGRGDDGLSATRQARQILLDQGFVEGEDLFFSVDQGAIHHESAWAKRLPRIFRFLLGHPGYNRYQDRQPGPTEQLESYS